MSQTFGDILKGYLVGKKLRHKNQYNREVILEVEDIKTEHRSVQITPDTKENDWWGVTQDWTETYICFVDGSKIQVSESTKLDIVEDDSKNKRYQTQCGG